MLQCEVASYNLRRFNVYALNILLCLLITHTRISVVITVRGVAASASKMWCKNVHAFLRNRDFVMEYFIAWLRS